MPVPSMTRPASLDEFESDLASVAAQAAVELDQLSLKRPIGFAATTRLVSLISSAVADVRRPASPKSLSKPGTAVALSKAIDEALYAGQPRTTRIPALIQQAARFKERLSAIVRRPNAATKDELEELRNVCVALSRQAIAVQSATRYKREHPYKKYM